jgi:outer membrane protein OmpA-like peptidoglycan-associated protein
VPLPQHPAVHSAASPITDGASAGPDTGAGPAEPDPDQPLPTTSFEVFDLDELLTEYEIRVADIIIEFDGQVTEEGTLLTLEEPILFDFDSDVLKDTARDALDDITEVLDYYADAPVEVVGHTDDVGSADYNLDLSQRRAEAVVAGLTERGIDPGRISAEGRGLTEPVASNDTEEGRAQNRRVEVLVVGVEPPEADHE